MKEWFKVWDRPEYQEWASPTEYGYLLVIIRKQSDNWLVAKAKLLMGESDLPGFEEIERVVVKEENDADSQAMEWREAG